MGYLFGLALDLLDAIPVSILTAIVNLSLYLIDKWPGHVLQRVQRAGSVASFFGSPTFTALSCIGMALIFLILSPVSRPRSTGSPTENAHAIGMRNLFIGGRTVQTYINRVNISEGRYSHGTAPLVFALRGYSACRDRVLGSPCFVGVCFGSVGYSAG